MASYLAASRGFGDLLRRAAGAFLRVFDLFVRDLFVRNSGAVLAATVAINRAFARRMECLPRNAGGIVDPRFFRLGITACGLALLDDIAAGLAHACVHFMQLVCVLDLDAKVIET